MKLKYQIGALFFVIVLLLNIILPSYILISFELNKEYIVENLCIEKDKEVNTCQGSCHLNKELEKITPASDDESNNQAPNLKESNINFFFAEMVSKSSFEFLFLIQNEYPSINFNTLKGVHNLCFKPPKNII